MPYALGSCVTIWLTPSVCDVIYQWPLILKFEFVNPPHGVFRLQKYICVLKGTESLSFTVITILKKREHLGFEW